MLKGIANLLTNLTGHAVGGGITHTLLGRFFGDGKEYEVLLKSLSESFKGESNIDAVRVFRGVEKTVRKRIEDLYGKMDLDEKERFESLLGKVLASCRNEVTSLPAILTITTKMNSPAKGKPAEIVEQKTAGGTRGNELFIEFWNSFKEEPDSTVKLYLDMLHRTNLAVRAWMKAKEQGRAFLVSPAWPKAKRYLWGYGIATAFVGVATMGAILTTLALAYAGAVWTATFTFLLGATGLFFFLTLFFPLKRVLEELSELLQEKEDENSWGKWWAGAKTKVGNLALLTLVLLLVKPPLAILPFLLLAGTAVWFLRGWKRLLGWGVILFLLFGGMFSKEEGGLRLPSFASSTTSIQLAGGHWSPLIERRSWDEVVTWGPSEVSMRFQGVGGCRWVNGHWEGGRWGRVYTQPPGKVFNFPDPPCRFRVMAEKPMTWRFTRLPPIR